MLLGLTGKKEAGKDTVGAYLVDTYDFTRLSFADTLKESAAALFTIDKGWWDAAKTDQTMKVSLMQGDMPLKSITVREFLQRYGTESHRDIFGFDFWVDALLPRGVESLKPVYNGSRNYVITDCRFTNEAERIREYGGKIVEIRRPNLSNTDLHSSEVPLPRNLVDHIMLNDKEIFNLHRRADSLMEAYGYAPSSRNS